MRLVPDQESGRDLKSTTVWLKRHCPPTVPDRNRKGAPGRCRTLSIQPAPTHRPQCAPCMRRLDASRMLMREGGSIPIVTDFKAHPRRGHLLLGLALPDANAHSPNESPRSRLLRRGPAAQRLVVAGAGAHSRPRASVRGVTGIHVVAFTSIMHSLKNYLLILLALVITGLSALAWRQHQEINALRAASLRSDERADLQKRVWTAQKRASDLEARLATSRRDGSDTAATPPRPIAPHPARRRRPAHVGFASMMDRPDMARLMAIQQKAQIDARFAPLFKKLGPFAGQARTSSSPAGRPAVDADWT